MEIFAEMVNGLSSSRAVSTYADTIILTNYIQFWDSVIELLLETFDMSSKYSIYQTIS